MPELGFLKFLSGEGPSGGPHLIAVTSEPRPSPPLARRFGWRLDSYELKPDTFSQIIDCPLRLFQPIISDCERNRDVETTVHLQASSPATLLLPQT